MKLGKLSIALMLLVGSLVGCSDKGSLDEVKAPDVVTEVKEEVIETVKKDIDDMSKKLLDGLDLSDGTVSIPRIDGSKQLAEVYYEYVEGEDEISSLLRLNSLVSLSEIDTMYIHNLVKSNIDKLELEKYRIIVYLNDIVIGMYNNLDL